MPNAQSLSHSEEREQARLAAFSLRKEELHASVSDPILDSMNFLNEITFRYPEAISFAPGRPYGGFFETEHITGLVRGYLDHLARQGDSPEQIRDHMYQYGPTAGRIRGLLADWLRRDEDIHVPPEALVVTVGAQEGMLLVLRALMSGPGDVLLVVSPCYVGITGAARVLDVPVAALPERDGHISPAGLDALVAAERARGRRPRALYVVPDHSNPSGSTMDLPTRRALLDRAAYHGVLLLEDSPYRMVSPGPQLPTLKSLDRSRTVVHLGSFSKTIFPGARVGFVVADQKVVAADGSTSVLADEIAKIKSMVTVNTSSLCQAVVAGALLESDGGLWGRNAPAAQHYSHSMRATLRALGRQLPAERRAELGVSWNEPTGGFFLVVRVPFPADAEALTRSARQFGVIWTPMADFFPAGGGVHGIRLSISHLTPDEIEAGTARLARFIESECRAASRAAPARQPAQHHPHDREQEQKG